MSIELEHKNRQLTSYAIDTAAMNEFHEKIRNLLMQLKNEVTTMTDEQRQLVTDMMNQLLHYNDKSVLDDFRLYFDEVHPEMLKRLSEQYPQPQRERPAPVRIHPSRHVDERNCGPHLPGGEKCGFRPQPPT